MERKNIKNILIIAALVSVFIFGLAYAQDDIQWLEHDMFVDRQRPAAAFPHAFHTDELEIDCLECHHVYDKHGENVWDESQETDCTACHKLEADGKKIPAIKAFHTNCKGCHTKEGKGPVTCGECHPWQKE